MALSLFDNSDTSQAQATDLVAQALAGSDDGELFVEKRETQGFSFDDGKLKAASFDESQGFGLRAVTGLIGKRSREKVSFATERDDRVPAYLFIPDSVTGRVPAVLCLHQTTGIGKGEPLNAVRGVAHEFRAHCLGEFLRSCADRKYRRRQKRELR